MQCKFFAGQKVVCVDAEPCAGNFAKQPRRLRRTFLERGKVYTISCIKAEPRAAGGIAVRVAELPYSSYHPSRFRAATNIQQFHDIVAAVFKPTTTTKEIDHAHHEPAAQPA